MESVKGGVNFKTTTRAIYADEHLLKVEGWRDEVVELRSFVMK